MLQESWGRCDDEMSYMLLPGDVEQEVEVLDQAYGKRRWWVVLLCGRVSQTPDFTSVSHS